VLVHIVGPAADTAHPHLRGAFPKGVVHEEDGRDIIGVDELDHQPER
jgi:hypothetical protein